MTTRVGTRAGQVRAMLDATCPNWRDELRRDMDETDPGWESVSVSVLNDDGTRSVVVLLARPESMSGAAA